MLSMMNIICSTALQQQCVSVLTVVLSHPPARCDKAAAGGGGVGGVSPGGGGSDCRWREGGGRRPAQDCLRPHGSPAAWR